jgi:hypothetical protein
MTTIAERVAKGAAYLDEHDPDWWREHVSRAINLNSLDLGDGRACVLGQRCPVERAARGEDSWGSPFDVQLRYITRGTGAWSDIGGWAAQHGFTSARGYGFHNLTAEWKRFIKARRAGAS